MYLSFCWKTKGLCEPKDIGFLLRKNPEKEHKIEVPYGTANLKFYQHSDDFLTMEFYHHVEPELTVLPQTTGGNPLSHYVSTIPYETGTLTAYALQRAFSSLLKGDCKEKPELLSVPFEADIEVTALACPERHRPQVLQIMKELGFRWRPAKHNSPTHMGGEISCNMPIREAMSKLVVLIRAAHGESPYRAKLGEQDYKKLLSLGDGWLSALSHESRLWLTYRVLNSSLARQFEREFPGDPAESNEHSDQATVENSSITEESTPGAWDQRVDWVFSQLQALNLTGQNRVVDIGCDGGKFILALLERYKENGLQPPQFIGIEPNRESRSWARKRLSKKSITVSYGALGYELPPEAVDADVYLLIEVIEHLPEREYLSALKLLIKSNPKCVLISTPNVEYNALWDLKYAYRHWDHKFELTRNEFKQIIQSVAKDCYDYTFHDIGRIDAKLGPLTQGVVLQCKAGLDWNEHEMPRLPSKEIMDIWVRMPQDPKNISWMPSTIAPCSGGLMKSLRETYTPTDEFDPDPKEMLEHPEAAFEYYRSRGVNHVVIEEKHMGSRCIARASTDYHDAHQDYGFAFYSRAGRSLLDRAEESNIKDGISILLSGFTNCLASKGYLRAGAKEIVFDGELLPWRAKAEGLIQNMYKPLADLYELIPHVPSFDSLKERKELIRKYKRQLESYSRDEPIRYAIWNVIPRASDMLATVDFQELLWEYLVEKGQEISGIIQTVGVSLRLVGTDSRLLDLNNMEECRYISNKWYRNSIHEGIVVKPVIPYTNRLPPAIKVRHPEYLRLIYGPEYTTYLNVLKGRSTGKKMALSIWQTELSRSMFDNYNAGNWSGHATDLQRFYISDMAEIDPRL